MEEKIIIKGKTNGLLCILFCFSVIFLFDIILILLFNNIPENNPTSIIATIFTYAVPLFLFIFIFSIIFFTKLAGSNINVTDTVIFGKTIWKHFYISYKEIISIKLLPLKGISIKTDNKSYKIYLLKNNEEIYNKLSERIK